MKYFGYNCIETGGIQFFAKLDGAEGWFWGMDYTAGDLYEAEELWREQHRITRNRLIFLHFPEGRQYEPLKVVPGQYLGEPVFYQEKIFFPLVDFEQGTINVFGWKPGTASEKETEDGFERIVRLPLSSVKDCYNLRLTGSPLTLIRQGHENDFQLLWPETGDFTIAAAESLDSRDGDKLLFSQWFEDPDYREETVVRHIPDGEITARLPGSLFTAPDGTHWILK
ncbi:MAG: hypothetical protein J5496_01175 [Lachnospiraceae bacterium]|nr:hypothetical protein [Lachnospiraceae bacterium]